MATITNITGVTSKTVEHLLLDAGAVYKNYGELDQSIVGATSGGSEFNVDQERKTTEIDGVRGPVMGMERVLSETAKLTINLKEITPEILKMALPGTTIDTTTDTEYDILKSKGKIDLTDYIKNIALIAKLSGSEKPVIIILKNVLSSGGLKISTKDKDEAVISIELIAHYDPATVGDSPYEIRYPKI